MNIERSLQQWSLEDSLFPKHMSFIIGPRQCGKTTLTKNYLAAHKQSENYINYDNRLIQKTIFKNPYFFESLQKPGFRSLLVFDEIHKMRQWKNYLKGVYDTFAEQFKIIVTGSGRLDAYQRGGDSLAGRYDPFFLYPLSPAEVEKKKSYLDIPSLEELLDARPVNESIWQQWKNCSGFPEPYLRGSVDASQRWWQQYSERVVKEDIRDLTKLESLALVQDLLSLLPDRVGSPLSLNSLREDLHCSHQTVQRYIRSLEQLFFIFSIPPAHKKIHRALKKERKYFFYFHPAVTDPGARFENAIALLLCKWCSSLREQGKGNFEVFYLRDQDQREVDFLISKNNKAMLLVEAKFSQKNFSSGSMYHQKKLNIPLVQVVNSKGIAMQRGNNIVISANRFIAGI